MKAKPFNWLTQRHAEYDRGYQDGAVGLDYNNTNPPATASFRSYKQGWEDGVYDTSQQETKYHFQPHVQDLYD